MFFFLLPAVEQVVHNSSGKERDPGNRYEVMIIDTFLVIRSLIRYIYSMTTFLLTLLIKPAL